MGEINKRIESGRLDHILRGWGHYTKQEIRRLVAQQRVTVNGQMCDIAGYDCPENSIICVDEVRLFPKPYITLMMNKPAGYVCVNGDLRYKNITSLLENEEYKTLFPVGRLDADTEGLIILTNTGEISSRVAHPEHETEKKYYAEFTRRLDPDKICRVSKGIEYLGNTYKPAEIQVIDEKSCYVTVTEGKYHEVKRLVRFCGGFVTYLKRISIGGLILDDTLQPGERRELTGEEIEKLFL